MSKEFPVGPRGRTVYDTPTPEILACIRKNNDNGRESIFWKLRRPFALHAKITDAARNSGRF